MRIPLREKLKASPLKHLYRSLRNVKRLIKGESLSGHVPMELQPLTLEELSSHLRRTPNCSRIRFSMAIQFLNQTPPDISNCWRELWLAFENEFESPERIALYFAECLCMSGNRNDAISLLELIANYDFNPDEKAAKESILNGEMRSRSPSAPLDEWENRLEALRSNIQAPFSFTAAERNDKPRVSVILPNYNYARYMKERIRSILNQTGRDLELIYLDDASADESNEIANEFSIDPRMTMHCFTKNSGKVYQRWNDGAALAKGDWLWFAGADDSADPNFLEKLLQMADRNPTAGILHCQFGSMNSDGAVIGMRYAGDAENESRLAADYFETGHDEAIRLSAGCIFGTASAMLIRRDAFEKNGGFDTRLWLPADWDLYLSILKDYDIAYCATPLAYYRSHRSTVTKTTKQIVRDLEDAYCVANAYEWISRDSRFTRDEREFVLNRAKARVFDLFAEGSIEIPAKLRFAAEAVYRVVPDDRLNKIV